MKKMRLIIGFLLLTLIACGQKKDDTFTKPVYFNQGLTTISITFPDGSKLTSALGLEANWSTLAGKPETFPPDAHSHSYNDLADKPEEVELSIAIVEFLGDIQILTQDQINALVIPVGRSKIVFNSTDQVWQGWNGSKWIIFATTNN